ncbi:MAG: WD40 repeat domain-containing serine/threonine protein kinase [Verrucomicrobiia bacterium]
MNPRIPETSDPSAEAITGPAFAGPMPEIPDHQLLRRIGRGAYGEVWLARSVTGAFRAVKIVSRAAFEHDRPFEREFEGILKFEPISRKHESQVDILHVGRGDGYFYYVMELADDQVTGGQIDPGSYSPRTLKSDVLLHARLPFDDCVRIGIGLTTALEHLHAHGLAHRDVKPSNVIFVNGQPKLADIGLVAGIDATRSYVGTEGFAAPEGPGSPQADLYSLGKVLYEIGTGKDRQEFPELPTNLRELPDREGLRELNGVIARACRHDPKDRYRSAAEMRADLELLQSGKSLARLRKAEARLRSVRRVGVASILLAVIVGAGWLWQARQTQRLRELAAEKIRLEAESRQRLIRLNIANGIQALDAGDAAGALHSFAEALPLMTNNTAEESVHRIRIQQTLARTPRVLQVFPHQGHSFATDVSRDGTRAVTARNSQVRVWDVRTGALIWERTLDVEPIFQSKFTTDGQRIFISTLRDHGFVESLVQLTNGVGLLNALTGSPVVWLPATNLLRGDLSPGDRWLVTADTNHVIRVHDANNGNLLAEITGFNNRVMQSVFSRRGDVVAATSEDRSVRVWQLPSGEPVHEMHFKHGRGPICVNRDGTLLAASGLGDDDVTRVVEVWDLEQKQRVGPPIEISSGAMSFLPDGKRLFIAARDEVRIYNCRALLWEGPIISPGAEHSIHSVSRDGSWVALGRSAGLLGVWSLETGERLLPALSRTESLRDLEFNANGSQLILSTESGVVLLSAAILQEDSASFLQAQLAVQGPDVRHRITPDRRHLLLPHGTNGTFSLVNLESLEEWRVPGPEQSLAIAEWFAIGPDGRQAAIHYKSASSASNSNEHQFIELWRIESGRTNQLVLPCPARLNGFMEFSSDGRRVTALLEDDLIRIWRTQDGALERSIAIHEELDGRDFLPDDVTLFAVQKRARIRLSRPELRPIGVPAVVADEPDETHLRSSQ